MNVLCHKSISQATNNVMHFDVDVSCRSFNDSKPPEYIDFYVRWRNYCEKYMLNVQYSFNNSNFYNYNPGVDINIISNSGLTIIKSINTNNPGGMSIFYTSDKDV